MLETVREPIVLADEDLRVVMYSAAFTELFGVEGDAIGKPLAEVGGHAWNDEETLRRLGDVMARARALWDFQRSLVTAERVAGGLLVTARRTAQPDSDADAMLVHARAVATPSTQEEKST